MAPWAQSCALSLAFSVLFQRQTTSPPVSPRTQLSNVFPPLIPFSCSGLSRFLTCCFKGSLTLFQKILGQGSHPLYLSILLLLLVRK